MQATKNRLSRLKKLIAYSLTTVYYPRTIKEYHKGRLEEYLDNGSNSRYDKWTKSIAVGSKEFIEEVTFLLSTMAKRRKNLKATEGYQLREPSVPIALILTSKTKT